MLFGGFWGEVAQWQADGAWQVFVLKLFAREDFDHSGATGLQLLNAVAINISWHAANSARKVHATWHEDCKLRPLW